MAGNRLMRGRGTRRVDRTIVVDCLLVGPGAGGRLIGSFMCVMINRWCWQAAGWRVSGH